MKMGLSLNMSFEYSALPVQHLGFDSPRQNAAFIFFHTSGSSRSPPSRPNSSSNLRRRAGVEVVEWGKSRHRRPSGAREMVVVIVLAAKDGVLRRVVPVHSLIICWDAAKRPLEELWAVLAVRVRVVVLRPEVIVDVDHAALAGANRFVEGLRVQVGLDQAL